MKLKEPDPRRVRIQVSAIAPGGKTVPGSSRSLVVFETTPEIIMRLIQEALKPASFSATDKLILDLCQEAGDKITDTDATLTAFRASYSATDIQAAAGGDQHALIRLRKACGLAAFKENP